MKHIRVPKITSVTLIGLMGWLLLLPSASAYADTIISYENHPLGSSISPVYFATGGDGNVWYIDYSNNIIGRINSDYSVTNFSVPGISGVGTNLVKGSDGNIWFGEALSNKIAKITPSGTVTEYSTATRPDGISLGPDNNIWYTSVGQGVIGKMTPSGTDTEYSTANLDDTFYFSSAGADGNEWFSGRDTNHIGKITPSGTITEYNVPTSSSMPMDVELGSDGNIWFPELSTSKVAKITPGGTVTEYPYAPTGEITDLLSAPDGNLWFSEKYVSKIGYFTTAGKIKEITPPAQFSDPFIGPDGQLWFYDYTNNQLVRIVETNSPDPGPSGNGSSVSPADPSAPNTGYGTPQKRTLISYALVAVGATTILVGVAIRKTEKKVQQK